VSVIFHGDCSELDLTSRPEDVGAEMGLAETGVVFLTLNRVEASRVPLRPLSLYLQPSNNIIH
jgi:hypothetical protein